MTMKAGIHPNYQQAKVICVCGNTFFTGSTLPEIRVEVCSNCHPFYTGQHKLITNIKGQVDKFMKAQETAKVKKAEIAKTIEARSAKVQKTQTEKPTLKELLIQSRKVRS